MLKVSACDRVVSRPVSPCVDIATARTRVAARSVLAFRTTFLIWQVASHFSERATVGVIMALEMLYVPVAATVLGYWGCSLLDTGCAYVLEGSVSVLECMMGCPVEAGGHQRKTLQNTLQNDVTK